MPLDGGAALLVNGTLCETDKTTPDAVMAALTAALTKLGGTVWVGAGCALEQGFTGRLDAVRVSRSERLFYDLQASPPEEVLLPFAIADAEVKAEWLSDRRGQKVAVLIPQRGPRRALVELARKNAAASFVSRRDRGQDSAATLARLQRRLGLPRPPRVIECFDISHVQGTDPVASMVVFEDGEPAKARYRTYRIKHAEGGDDFASMYEVLSRRFRRGREAGSNDSSWRLPDLLVVDGGKGQLSVALAAARDAGVDVRPGVGLPIVALAKERDFATGEVGPASAQVGAPTPGPSGDAVKRRPGSWTRAPACCRSGS